MSAKLLKEGEHCGLTLVEGAVPAWWEVGDLMKGLLSPDQAARVEQLVREDMLRDFAREAVLAKRPSKQT